ncbi:hypothetical protein PDIG_61430 [Penicillium digitatum PHI26]|uniref:Mesaconyl-C4 CoA hydratase n=2 Tax=Penicillium digitatum TaxID=36651 RepID=K9G3W4_PEND2|nr:hypothetical protein PDIP_70860 [Penicillium digitatum Pd1]EKV07910.1 hypothetical protein PDIP_70860 [Penicillium digitatum Pd1]EKV09533.1 hypothetical protein PDIG_61430 [Penicillium digitatum PHI26]
MSRHLRSDASSVASAFLSRFQSLGPQTRTQTIDGNQLQLLTLTLNRPPLFPGACSLSNCASAPQSGVPVPPGYHLVYFTPAFLESELGADGTDTAYNPDVPFTRRMWAGGEVLWPRVDGMPNLLRVGQQVQETTRVLSAESKILKKTGEEIIVVSIEKEFSNEHGVSIIDRRVSPSSSTSHFATPNPTSPVISTEGNTHARTLVQTPATLFRFSALTFNPHKIHYSLPWARDVEGHKDIAVHGPLNLISILDLWRDTRQNATDSTLVVPERRFYRATNPLYAGDEYRIVLEEGEGTQVQIIGPGRVVAMKAEIH